MPQSPTATAIAEAVAELYLYADTEEARAARVLIHAFVDLDEIDRPAVHLKAESPACGQSH
jgi:hypothetical protein